jgi:putative ABC transport system substrate-binding protein
VGRAALLLLLLLLSAPGFVRAEEGRQIVRRVGVLAWRESTPTVMVREGIRRGLQQTRLPIRIEEETCGGEPARAETVLARWKAARFDLYFAIDPEAAKFLESREKDVPVVFVSTRHPVDSGITGTLGPGGGNRTGVFLQLDMGAVLDFFRSIVPGLETLGAIHSETEAGIAAEVTSAVEVQRKPPGDTPGPVRIVTERVNPKGGWPALRKSVETLVAGGIQALWLPDDPFVLGHIARLSEITNPAGVPLLATHPHGVRRYTTVGISPDYRRLGVWAAALCARIVRDGVEPGSLPVWILRAGSLVVNLRAAERAGLTVPLEVLPRADVIIDRDGW